MRNLTHLATSLFMGACLLIAPSVHAEETEPGTSFTHKIVNPGFDSNNGNGWTIEAEKNVKYGFTCMEVYEATFNVRQTIRGLVPGVYSLTVNAFQRPASNDAGAAYADGTEVINAFLYAKTNQKSKETPLQSLYSVPDFQPAGGAMDKGYINNLQSGSDAFSKGLYLSTVNDILVMSDSTLIIGVKTTGSIAKGSWSMWDNFTLTYMGESSTGVYQEIIYDLGNNLDELITESALPSGNYEEIFSVFEYQSEYGSSSDVTELLAVMDSMSNVLSRAQIAKQALIDLTDLVEKAKPFLELEYPGSAAYEDVINRSEDLIQEDATTPDGGLVFERHLLAAIEELNVATRTYRFTQPIEDAEIGINISWSMKAPHFTKEGGNSSLLADASAEGWKTNNNPVDGDYRLNMVNTKNCWNNWRKDGFISMDLYQELESMPEGVYAFSCFQTNDGPDLTDQHAYITAGSGTSKSAVATYSFAQDTNPNKGSFTPNSQWEELTTGKIIVGADGKLRVGMASTGNGNGTSGWFCMAECTLTYYGKHAASYAEALQAQIEIAEALQDQDMLGTDMKTLTEGITAAKAVDTADADAIQAGMEVLNTVISKTDNAIKTLQNFRSVYFMQSDSILANQEGIYPASIVSFVGNGVTIVNGILASDTTTTAAFTYLKDILGQHIAYSRTYISYQQYADTLSNVDFKAIFTSMLAAETANVTSDYTTIGASLLMFKEVKSFILSYDRLFSFTTKEEYAESKRNTLAQTCDAQLAVVKGDYTKVYAADRVICAMLGDMIFADLGIAAGENTEVTEVALVNPTIVSDNRKSATGWQVEASNALNNDILTAGQHWTGKGQYFDAYNSAAGLMKLNAFQEVKGIPNGTYKLMATSRGNSDGIYLYAKNGNEVKYTQVPNNGNSGGSIWKTTEVDSIKNVNGGSGYGWNWVEVADINVYENAITIGITNKNEVVGVASSVWTGTWFSGDDFKLFWISSNYNGIEENEAEPISELIAYVQDGRIVVEAEEYTISTLNGMLVSADAQLPSGIYIVTSGEQTVKVIVK